MKSNSGGGRFLRLADKRTITAPSVNSKFARRSTVHGCGCRDCNEVTAETAHMTTAAMVTDVSTNIHVGDRVLVRGAFTGVVRYVGDLDSRFVDSRLYVGVKLDDPYGDHDGVINGKRYFKCPPNHGILVTAEDVALLPDPRKTYTKRITVPILRTSLTSNKPDKKIPLNGRNKKLNAQNSRFSSSTQCLKLFDQLPFPQKQRSIRFNVQECEIIPEIHTYREGSMSSYKTPANCYPDSLTKESTLSSSSCQFSAYPSSLMSSELTFFDNDSSNSVECSLGLFSDFELSSPPTPYPFKDYEAEKEQLENEDAERRSHKLTEDLLARRAACFRVLSRNSSRHLQVNSSIERKPSYSRRLLSGIPAKGMLPPGPDDECCSDFGEMCNVTHAWGSDNRSLKMAATAQMLNEGQRSGQKQIIWQKKLDEVGEFLNHKARVAHIREFQESLADSKDEVIACEAEMRAKEREQGWHTTKSKAREKQLQDSIDDYERKCCALQETIRRQPLVKKSQVAKLLKKYFV